MEGTMNYQDAIVGATQSDPQVAAIEAWSQYLNSLHEGVERLQRLVTDVEEMRQVCSDEWCETTECLLGELTVAVFAISEPHWTAPEESRKIKDLKKKLHDLHARHSSIQEKREPH
jgi:hypothetical protein